MLKYRVFAVLGVIAALGLVTESLAASKKTKGKASSRGGAISVEFRDNNDDGEADDYDAADVVMAVFAQALARTEIRTFKFIEGDFEGEFEYCAEFYGADEKAIIREQALKVSGVARYNPRDRNNRNAQVVVRDEENCDY